METILNIVSIIIIVFGILQIILFFKVWGMTNNVSEMKNMMEQFLKKDFQDKDKFEPTTSNITNNIEPDKEDFPSNTKFCKGDIVIYKPENMKLTVIGYMSPNIFKCKTMDGIDKTYCFQEEYLDQVRLNIF